MTTVTIGTAFRADQRVPQLFWVGKQTSLLVAVMSAGRAADLVSLSSDTTCPLHNAHRFPCEESSDQELAKSEFHNPIEGCGFVRPSRTIPASES